MKRRFRRNVNKLQINHIVNLFFVLIVLLIISTGYSLLEENLILNLTISIDESNSNQNAYNYKDEKLSYNGLTIVLNSERYFTINGKLNRNSDLNRR